jgi:hypothetical protein
MISMSCRIIIFFLPNCYSLVLPLFNEVSCFIEIVESDSISVVICCYLNRCFTNAILSLRSMSIPLKICHSVKPFWCGSFGCYSWRCFLFLFSTASKTVSGGNASTSSTLQNQVRYNGPSKSSKEICMVCACFSFNLFLLLVQKQH